MDVLISLKYIMHILQVMTEKERNELKEALTTEFFGAQNPQIGLEIRLTGITTE